MDVNGLTTGSTTHESGIFVPVSGSFASRVYDSGYSEKAKHAS